MTNYERALKDIQKHSAKFEKALYKFYWQNRYTAFQVDLYYYPDTGKFEEFCNPGGNSWIDDNHIAITHVNHETGELEPGSIRAAMNDYKDFIIPGDMERIEEMFKRLIADENRPEEDYIPFC